MNVIVPNDQDSDPEIINQGSNNPLDKPAKANPLDPAMKKITTEILSDADTRIHGELQAKFGDPEYHYGTVAQIWSAILGVHVSPKEVILCLTGVELAKAKHPLERDVAVEIASQAGMLGLIEVI